MTQAKRYMLTAALPYANGPIHIGHLAGVYIPADIYARYLRLREADVLLVCGSDEHGVPVTIRAQKEGISVQEVVDKYHKLIEQSFQDFGISFDIYARTSNATHHQTSSDFFKVLHQKGLLLEKESEQFFDPEASQFLADRYIQGTCPHCGNANAYGDQCEKCGSTLSPQELIEPRSMLSGAKPVMKNTKHWYLPLDQYEPWLREWILEGHQKDWKSNVYGQCKSWIEQGLQPRAVTRDLDWGVPVPLPDAQGKVLYVWFDAPIGYISATKDYFKLKNADEEAWKKYWQSEDSTLIHFIGKDNIVFHCIIFPVMLHAHGDFVVPQNVPANEFLNLEGDKISTSRNWAVWLHEYLQEFPEQQDALRYVLTANAPETKDNDFTWKDFQARNNNELVANVGNFVNRVLTLTDKYFANQVPPMHQEHWEQGDIALVEALKTYPNKIAEAIEQYRFREALGFLMEFSSLGNKYLQDNAPWTLAKDFEDNRRRIEIVLHLSLQIVANFAFLAEPFLPFAAQKIQKALGLGRFFWRELGVVDLVIEGQPIEKIGLLFQKIEDSSIEYQKQKLENSKQSNMQNEQSPTTNEIEAAKEHIQYEDFAKLDLRIATIIAAEKLPKSEKLLKITLDTGLDQRVVLSGIAKHFAPEAIIGQQVVLLLNLSPKKMAGETSNGMILMAEDAQGALHFVAPSAVIRAGSTVR